MAKQPECPECEKLSAVSKKSQEIGEFLDWLQHERHLVLAEWDKEEDYKDNALFPVHISIDVLLAEYFKIDLAKVEQERQALLEWIRNQPDAVSYQ